MIFPYNTLKFKYEYGKLWMLLFYHNCTYDDFFVKDDEILFSNTSTKFSLFGYGSSFKSNGAYEFLLEYPEVEGHNRWRQTIFPLNTDEAKSSENGFISSSCDCSWTPSFKGLIKSASNDKSILDCAQAGDWWYSIGAKTNYTYFHKIPGPISLVGQSYRSHYVSEVYLWIHAPKHGVAQIFQITFHGENFHILPKIPFSLFFLSS